MKNQKGYSIIEVIVATLALSIVFIPITQSLINGVKMHVRARTHLDYIYKAQEVVEDERILNHVKGTVSATTTTTSGHFSVKTTYNPIASGLLGETMDFSTGDDNYEGNANRYIAENEAYILYDGEELFINEGSQMTSVFTPADQLQLVVTQVGINKVLSVNRVESDGNVLNLSSKTILDHEVDLNCYLSLVGVESSSPTLNLEVVNNIVMSNDSIPNDILFNVELDEHNKLNIKTTRASVDSGNINLIERLRNVDVIKDEDNDNDIDDDVYLENYYNDSVLLEMDIDVQLVAPDGTYSIQQIETLQKND